MRRLRKGLGHQNPVRRATSSRLFNTGLLPQAAYGTAVYGLCPAELRDVQTAFLSCAASRAGGRSRSISLLLCGDSSWRAAMAPFLQWSKEVWAATSQPPNGRAMPLSSLRETWHSLWPKAPDNWNKVRGPVGALKMCLEYVGWSMEDAFTFKDDFGVTRHLTASSPKFVATLVSQAWRKGPGEKGSQQAGAGTTWAPLPWPCGGGAAQQQAPALSPVQAGTLCSFVTQAMWTEDRLQRAGYRSTGLCSCGAPDTPFHRLWTCPKTKTLRDKQFKHHELMIIKDDRLLAMGLLTHPAEKAQLLTMNPEVMMPEGLEIGPNGFQGEIFVDGSCFKSVAPELARAGWAALLYLHGVVVACIYGALPGHLIQSSPAAEYYALQQAIKFLAGFSNIYSDYAGSVSLHKAPVQLRGKASKVHAGINRVSYSIKGHLVEDVLKVKAHQSLEGLEGEALRLASGNHEADHWAKQGALKHPAFPQQAEVERTYALAVKVARYAAEALLEWPAMGAAGKHQLLPKRRRLQPRLHPGPDEGGEAPKHVWDVVPSQHRQGMGLARQRCRCCLAVVKGSGLMIKKRPCPGSSVALKLLVNDPKGHVLVACDACPGFVLACSRCGRYTTGGNQA